MVSGMVRSDQPTWIRVLEVTYWPAALVLSSLTLGETPQKIASAAIPVSLEVASASMTLACQ